MLRLVLKFPFVFLAACGDGDPLSLLSFAIENKRNGVFLPFYLKGNLFTINESKQKKHQHRENKNNSKPYRENNSKPKT